MAVGWCSHWFWSGTSTQLHSRSAYEKKMEFLQHFSPFLVLCTQVRFLPDREMASGRREMRKSLENPISGVNLLNNWWLKHLGNTHLNGCAWEMPLFLSSSEKLHPVSKIWNQERNPKSLSDLEFYNRGILGLEGMFMLHVGGIQASVKNLVSCWQTW